ncbi:MAG: GH1 family beta-glucosidase [Phycisphaerales bacterium JB054]
MGFPQDFVWGAGTSSYQIEGGVEKHGRGPSVWDKFCETPGKIKHGHTGRTACDHVTHYKEDVQLIKNMGLDAYRFSISWSRVMPEGAGAVSEAGLAFYDRLVDELLASGVTPWVTLFHWDYPITLYRRGGWLNPSSASWFAEYTRAVVDRLSDRVSNWITINEPQVFVGHGHMTAEHAPGLSLPFPEITRIVHNVLRAHGLAARCIRECAQTKPVVGWAPVGIVSSPTKGDPEEINAARAKTFEIERPDVWNNSWFNDPVVFGEYPDDLLALTEPHLPDGWERDLEIIKQPLDFLGLNLYQGARVTLGKGQTAQPVPQEIGRARTAFGWNITPEVLYWGPRFFHERYKLPIAITENGLANLDWVGLDGRVQDPQRIDYTARHLLELRRAIDDGVPVLGYFHWSLLDNFEWAEGYDQRFGLVYVDFETQERIPKQSAEWYAEVVRSNGESLGTTLPQQQPSRTQVPVRGK